LSNLLQPIQEWWTNTHTFLADNPVESMAVSLVAGALLAECIRISRERYSTYRELKANQNIKLGGDDWVALWQAAADGDEVLNFEDIIISQRGSQISIENKAKSPENPKGGYRWKGRMEFSHGETLMGSYYSENSENNTNRGMMYFTYDSTRQLFLGRWVGKAIDGPLCSGFVVISKNREASESNLKALMARAGRHPVNVIAMDFLRPPEAA